MTKLTCFATIWTLGILLLLSCNQQPTGKSTAEANSEVATLLDRHPALRNGVEWDKVQNWLLIKNPRFLSTHEKIRLTKFHKV